MGFLQNLVADIPDNFQISHDNDEFDEPKPKKRKKPNITE